jgi:hypothetical protein
MIKWEFLSSAYTQPQRVMLVLRLLHVVNEKSSKDYVDVISILVTKEVESFYHNLKTMITARKIDR